VNFIGSSSVAAGVTERSMNNVMIYPNPSSTGIYTIDLGTASSKSIITVYDIVGKTISSKEVDSSSKQMLDISNQQNGCYFVSIKNDSGTTTKKVILNK
jgi:hypothetical protein